MSIKSTKSTLMHRIYTMVARFDPQEYPDTTIDIEHTMVSRRFEVNRYDRHIKCMDEARLCKLRDYLVEWLTGEGWQSSNGSGYWLAIDDMIYEITLEAVHRDRIVPSMSIAIHARKGR